MNQLDSPLTGLGQIQADRLASRLQKLPIEAIYSSDLGRAIATAQVISAKVGIPVRPSPEMREKSIGIFAGLTWAEVNERYPQDLERYRSEVDFAPIGGETSGEFQDRTITFVKSIAEKHKGRQIAIVTHGGNLGAMFRFTAGLSVNHALRARLPNASFNEFDVADDVWKLRVWGDISHLEN